MADVRQQHGRLTPETGAASRSWLHSHRASLSAFTVDRRRIPVSASKRRLSFAKRSQKSVCADAGRKLSCKIFALIEKKQSNLCLAGDCSSAKELLQLTSFRGRHIVVLKLHVSD